MAKIVECVPNISEGRNKNIIETIVNEVRNTENVTLLDYSSDESHNRTVISFLGDPEKVKEAVVKLAKKAVELIDMTKHKGEHPRMGSVDVIPFIPIKDMSMEETILLSEKAASEIYETCKLPVTLYEESAKAPHRVNLAAIRKGQFEHMAEKVLEDDWAPDYGERKIHPTAGLVAVGARMPLIAFNINLNSSNIDIANQISKIIRRSSGGFDCVKAIGVMLNERNIAQVSINMTNFNKTPLYRVLELVKAEAKRYGVGVVGTEIIGLTPMSALVDCAAYYMQIENFDTAAQVLENHLL